MRVGAGQYDPRRGRHRSELQAVHGHQGANLRYASFDYCFNYFQSHRDDPRELVSPGGLETSCLQLGFYLASWSMFRASSQMLRRSSKHLAPLVSVLANDLAYRWGLDVDGYDTETIPKVRAAEIAVRRALRDAPDVEATLEGHGLKGLVASETLTTKILLGVFGCRPSTPTFVEGSRSRPSAQRPSSRSGRLRRERRSTRRLPPPHSRLHLGRSRGPAVPEGEAGRHDLIVAGSS